MVRHNLGEPAGIMPGLVECDKEVRSTFSQVQWEAIEILRVTVQSLLSLWVHIESRFQGGERNGSKRPGQRLLQ